ncbi:MAG: EAL domain-containing protein, partial [Oscillospiraceae bacterium]|nr:EAL domain-containing protein [Oscillospiraceae bacterium]
GVENIEEEARRQREQRNALNLANELARRDILTGVKNKTAFEELEQSVQSNIDNGMDYLPFAIVVCDINDLKHINDTRGHKSGDAFIRAACRMICNVFLHSPVFRIGGDEFAVFVRSNDYDDRETLLKKLRNLSLENMMNSDKPVVATGMAVYDYKHDASFSAVFERADRKMYENKVQLKQDGLKKLLERDFRLDEPIPPARRERLDEMFDALSLAAEGAYVFFCDVRYDYTRWSKAAVGMFDLPSEYLYDAGNVIADRLHPDDRGLYRTSYDAVFAGIASAQDLQFRMKKADGTYEVCTSRSVVLRDQNGDPEYYCGTMRSLGMQGRVDSLTGLRNLYGFFEDLQTNIRSSTESMICLIGVSKFSEINEVYGYQFGNRVLQKFSSHLRDSVGNDGSVYRLDGTKFAVLTELDAQEIRMRYEELRLHCRESFIVDEKSVILDLNAGLLSVDHFDIDYETVYACLNYAHGESKVRRQGDLVEFNSGLNNDNKQRIEKLHAIRASIMQQFYGFYLLYQPVVDAQTEQIIGAEALLRWKSDEYGMVPPDHFIPVLEKDSLFCDLGQWILRTAVRGAKIAMRKHPDFVINVNLSYTQLEKPDFVDMVFSILHEEEFPPEHLCLEITERCRLLDMDLLKIVIVNLRGQGVRIALDDFGTGFSSIGLVKNLQFDTIKIDRSFVL